MARAKGRKNYGKPKAMPASKKRALLKGKPDNAKSSKPTAKGKNQTDDADDDIDNFLDEVSKKLEKGPVPKGNESPKQRKKSRKGVAGKKKAKSVPSRANTMKTTQGSGAQVNKGKLATSAKTINSAKSQKAAPSKYLEVDSDYDDEENEEGEEETGEESNAGSDWNELEDETVESKVKATKKSGNNSKTKTGKKAKVSKKPVPEEESEEEESEEEPVTDDGSDDNDYSPNESLGKKKPKATKRKAVKKKGGKAKKSTASAKKDLSEDEFDEEETEEESEEEAETDDNDYSPGKGLNKGKSKKLKRKSSKNKGKSAKAKLDVQPKKEKIPPVSEMVVDSIKALGANPKKGSNLRSIKTTILLNWTINIKMYNKKIKKFILGAIEKGDIVRVSGKGFNGRFTVPGMKIKKKKKTMKLGKKFDEDEAEYAPKRTRRDDGRDESKVVIEKEREKRKVLEEKLLKEKESRPKKKVVKKQVWEVEAIKGIKDKNHEKYYLVKWKGFAKLNWEPAENVRDCDNLIDAYVDATKKKEEAQEKWKRLAEKGTFEPDRILDTKVVKGKRQFLIRWKGHGSENDKWELESKLNCRLMIEKFMLNHEKELQRTNSTREMREAPKRLDRFVFASSKRVAKRSGGLGISYAGMDED